MGIKRPPRLATFDYRGRYRYFLTICTAERQPTFTDIDIGRATTTNFLHAAEDAGFATTAYCLLPDHLHAVIAGTRDDADLRHFVRIWKQRTGYAWKQRTGLELWQEGYYDRVLRPEESDLLVAAYIAGNPVWAGLADTPEQYPLFGSPKYSPAEIFEALSLLAPSEWRRAFGGSSRT